MELVRGTHVGEGLLHDLRDRCRVQEAQRGRVAGIERPAHLHGPRAALLERRVVEVGVGRRIQDFMRQRRRLGRIARQHADLAVVHPLQETAQRLDVHRLGQAVAQRLAHQRMIGRLDRPGRVLLALDLRGENLREQVVRPHAEDVEGNPLPGARPQDGQRTGRVPAPANAPHRREQRCLREHLVDAVGCEEIEDRLQRKAVLRTQREQYAFVGRRSLQLEVERAAEALAQRQPEGAVLPRAERRVDDHLHPTSLVEEPLGDQRALRRERAQRGLARRQVAHDLFRAFRRNAALRNQPRHGLRRVGQKRLQLFAQRRHFQRQLRRAPRRLSVPERHRGRRAVRILHPHAASLDAPDAPALVAEQEDVAGHALDGPVLVHLPDGDAFRLGHHRVLRRLRDRAARRDRRDPRPAPRFEHLVHAVAVQPRPLRATGPPRHALGVHLDERVELRTRQVAIRPGPLDQLVRGVLGEIFARRHRYQLLREHVARPLGNPRDLEGAGPHPAHQGRALDQLIARDRKEATLGNPAPMVRGAPDALQRDREAARRLELDDEVDRAHVDAELERGRGHRAADISALQLLLGREPHRPRQRAVVRHHLVLAQPLPERVRNPLHLTPRVGEDERGLVLPDQLRDAVVHLLALLLRGHRRQLVARHFDEDVQRPPRPALDDGAGPSAGEETADLLDRPLRRRQSHPHAPPPT